jgi:cytidine deaminase
MTKNWLRGFEIAKTASLHGIAPRKSRQVGAALFSGSKLVAIGMNRYNYTHPEAKWGIHAEHSALIKRRYYTDQNLIMYVYRELADGKPACSKPCLTCLHLIKESNVRAVRFIDENGVFKQIQI